MPQTPKSSLLVIRARFSTQPARSRSWLGSRGSPRSPLRELSPFGGTATTQSDRLRVDGSVWADLVDGSNGGHLGGAATPHLLRAQSAWVGAWRFGGSADAAKGRARWLAAECRPARFRPCERPTTVERPGSLLPTSKAARI